ncbi:MULTISPECIES: hypothetical protein [unclassified Crossiella]|uniref:hypothetical protein n=1 Tax=unclassified Crossiella TaxID=2620835 RepID=UPI001FFF1284|nr:MULTISPECIES: hypothetical protein [unclassified Crossiella]MCK2240760.1 hypothetical protein [Crossiella sp. S99.2]MCK2254096.1 hypothetical protein [Crossiella sp. S99.1]
MVRVTADRLAVGYGKSLKGRQRKSYDHWLADLKQRGCAAMQYRLHGTGVDHFCVSHLYGALRVVVAFESSRSAVIVLLGPHDNADPGLDVYTRLYNLADIPVPTGRRTKPPCCAADGKPPELGAELAGLMDRMREQARALTGRLR